VVSRFVDVVMGRLNKRTDVRSKRCCSRQSVVSSEAHAQIEALARDASVPVINGLGARAGAARTARE
jgi:ornithine carbamoyltransferase